MTKSTQYALGVFGLIIVLFFVMALNSASMTIESLGMEENL